MSVSIIGAVLVFFACSTVGAYASRLCRERLYELEAFRSLIAHIGAEICGYLTPLERIYESFESEYLTKNGFIAELRTSGGEMALEKCRDRLFLTAEEYSELKRFFSELGSHDADGEAKLCAYFEKRFAEHTAAARGQVKGQSRLCTALGMLAGIMLAVILL